MADSNMGRGYGLEYIISLYVDDKEYNLIETVRYQEYN